MYVWDGHFAVVRQQHNLSHNPVVCLFKCWDYSIHYHARLAAGFLFVASCHMYYRMFYLSGLYLLQIRITGDVERELLAKLYLGWEILNDFHQILAALCKGLIYRVSFQASLGGNVKES